MNPRLEVERVYSLTPLQEGILFHNLMERESEAYFEQIVITLDGNVELNLLEKGFNILIARHEVLRTNFIHEKVKRPQQVVLKKRHLTVLYKDIRDLNFAEKTEFLEDFKQSDRRKKFDLSRDLLMRVAIIRLEDRKYCLIWSYHHIIMDGWCLGIIFKELLDIYQAFRLSKIPVLSPTPAFHTYIEWLENRNKSKAVDYWREYLRGYEQKASIPQKTVVDGNGYSRGEYDFSIGISRTTALTKLAHKYRITLNTVFVTLWGILLQKYNDATDVVFGMVVSGRNADIPDIESMIGLFINTVPVRITRHDDQTYGELLQQVHRAELIGREYDDCPLVEIQNASLLKNNLFTHILTFENYPVDREINRKLLQNESVGFKLVEIQVFEQTNFDLDVTIVGDREINFKIYYNTLKYEPNGLQRLENHLKILIDAVSEHAEIVVRTIDILTQTEKEQILFRFNNHIGSYRLDKYIPQLIEEQAVITPDRRAILFENTTTTYVQLNEKSNRIARFLLKRGVIHEDLIAIMMERSPLMVEIILGIWKVGAAYIPIDPEYPVERKKMILKESGVRFLVTASKYWEALIEADYPGHLIKCDEWDESLMMETVDNPGITISAADLAYVIYTSGSTGKPKGAMIEHLGMVNHILAEISELQIGPDDVMAQNASHCFDISVWQFFATLTTGGTTAIYRNELILSPQEFIHQIIRDCVSILEVVPSYLAVMLDCIYAVPVNFQALRYLMITGETVSVPLVRRWFEKFPNIQIVNAYGPAEAADDVTQFVLSEVWTGERIPVGKPLPNMNIYIASRDMQLCPVGVVGEICVAGIGVGRGYLGNREKTMECFLSDPFSGNSGRLYKTGDLGRWLPDGNIDFFGRRDSQVKIRGNRIELGEIENQLVQHQSVKEAIVLVKEESGKDKYLCAFVVLFEGAPSPDLRDYLRDYLPESMIPSRYVWIEKMPLTVNGKIDRQALAKHELLESMEMEYTPPQTRIEKILVQIWKKVLEQERIGVMDSFFNLGGHSLKATTLIQAIRKELQVEVPLREVFRRQTIRQLAEYIQNAGSHFDNVIPLLSLQAYYETSAAQKRMFLLHQFEKDKPTYNMPGGLLLSGSLERRRLEETIQNLVDRHEGFRTSFHLICGELMQMIHTRIHLEIHYLDGVESVHQAMSDFVKPFDLATPPLLRVGLLQIAPAEHVLLFDMHHIISDGISLDILIRDFQRLYAGQSLNPLRVQYKDYAAWQNRIFTGSILREQESYWLNCYKGEIPTLNLVTDYSRPEVQTYIGARIKVTLEEKVVTGIGKLAEVTGTSVYMIFLAIYNVLLYRYTSQEDIIIGSPVAGRSHPELENIIGMFVNMLAMRNFPRGDYSFREFLLQVKRNCMEAYENQEYPFETLVSKLNLARDTARNPLFSVAFSLVESNKEYQQVEGIQITPYEFDLNSCLFDIMIDATVGHRCIEIVLTYRVALFNSETMHRWIDDFQSILNQVMENPEISISEVEFSGINAPDHPEDENVSELSTLSFEL